MLDRISPRGGRVGVDIAKDDILVDLLGEVVVR